MHFLPRWDLIDGLDFNDTQKVYYVIFTYFTAIAFFCLLCFANYNYFKFVLGRPRMSLTSLCAPLSLFYLLAMITIIFRIISILVWVWATESNLILFITLPPLFKLNVGLIQAWIMIELTLRVN